nr:NADH dehydrogenase subunit 2 [Pampus argenteus]
MSPFTLIILSFSLILGTVITMTSSHWLLAWMGLEINTLAFIPLMARNHHPRAVEASTKYFLIQATAAAMLLFASATEAWITGGWQISQLTDPFTTTIITIALALKIGLAPAHAWMPEVMQGLDLPTGLIMATWQKLAPFTLLIQIHQTDQNLLIFLGLTSMLVGGLAGLNQTQLRKIMAYSSIAHMGWLVLIMQFFQSMSFLALLIYFVTTFSTFLVFKLNKATSINTLATSWAKTPVLTALTPLVLLSLGGLPPLTGFMPKWLILQELTKQELAPLATVAALTALLSLYFYLRLTYAMTLTMAPNNTTNTTCWRLLSTQNTLPITISIIATLLLLPIAPALVMVMNY